jgi:hypothetical protein
MAAHLPVSRSAQPRSAKPYVLAVRGPDGRIRLERFDDAAAYRKRLLTLESSRTASVSIDEIIGLLDA